jgi:hypothetical protein
MKKKRNIHAIVERIVQELVQVEEPTNKKEYSSSPKNSIPTILSKAKY